MKTMDKKRDILSTELEMAEKEALKDMYSTAISKVRFINEIKSGMGEDIKKNPNRVKVVEKTKPQKIKDFFKKLFSIL